MESFQTVIPGPQSIWSWWVDKFPQSARIYGEPVHWNEPNLDFLASALGELPYGIIIYSHKERFYFRNYIFESAYRPTEDEKLVVESGRQVSARLGWAVCFFGNRHFRGSEQRWPSWEATFDCRFRG